LLQDALKAEQEARSKPEQDRATLNRLQGRLGEEKSQLKSSLKAEQEARCNSRTGQHYVRAGHDL